MTGNASRRPWWATAAFYQIYPRSFADGNGDGTGDLPGIRERLPYLRDLGVDALWISPFYRSPMADGGYDVSDPCDVDPLFGTLADFDALLAEAHRLGIRVTIDLVPNHFSDRHPWFEQALRDGPGSAARARFIFRSGRGAHGELPPNNWPSVFGGSAWTRVPDGEWYLHIFAAEQPDLDWTNPDVPAEFERIMRFWLDRGIDGFRIDVAHGMAKPADLPDVADSVLAPTQGGAHMPSAEDLRWDRDHVHDYHRRFRRLLDSYPGDRMAVGEVWVSDDDRLAHYAASDELNLAFNFKLIQAEWGAETFADAIRRSMAAMARVQAPCTWVLANHDVDRAVTRYGGGRIGVARARAAALVTLSLPGAVFVYFGDELGLPNVDLPDWALQDPTWERSRHTARGRDAQRVPMPWSGDAPPFGFSTGPASWLPMPPSWASLTVQAEQADSTSTLSLYRAALRLRRTEEDLRVGEFAWLDAPADCLTYCRGRITVVLNASTRSAPLPAGEVLLASEPLDGPVLPANAAAWLRAD